MSTLFRVIADLLPLFDSPHGARIILGGDLNVSVAHSDPNKRVRGEAVLAAIRSLGLVEAKAVAPIVPISSPDCNCGAGGTCGHLSTWGTDEIDHLFVSPALANQVTAVSVDRDVVGAGLSDHVPLVLDLALTSERTPHPWDEESFAEEIGRRHGPAAREVVERLVNWADNKERELASAARCRDQGSDEGSNGTTANPELWFPVDLNLAPRGSQNSISIKANGDVVVWFGAMRHPPFDIEAMRHELRRA